MRFLTGGLVALVALSLASVGCAATAEEGSGESEVMSGGLSIVPGTFVLHEEQNHTADPKCDSFTDLEIKNGQAHLKDRLTGGCALVALHDPNPRAYTLKVRSAGCGSKIYEGARRVALGPATTGIATITITDHRERICMDLPPNQLSVEEKAPGKEARVLFNQVAADPGIVLSPPSPDFCRNGRIETTPNFIDSADGKECSLPKLHCVTKDQNACPMFSPLPPDFCKGGRVVSEPGFIASADGMECSVPRIHCVTKDQNACPMFSPLPPDFCKDGTVKSEPGFIASADGMECSVPRIHCVTKDPNACPML